jgi:hypothetical protein
MNSNDRSNEYWRSMPPIPTILYLHTKKSLYFDPTTCLAVFQIPFAINHKWNFVRVSQIGMSNTIANVVSECTYFHYTPSDVEILNVEDDIEMFEDSMIKNGSIKIVLPNKKIEDFNELLKLMKQSVPKEYLDRFSKDVILTFDSKTSLVKIGIERKGTILRLSSKLRNMLRLPLLINQTIVSESMCDLYPGGRPFLVCSNFVESSSIAGIRNSTILTTVPNDLIHNNTAEDSFGKWREVENWAVNEKIPLNKKQPISVIKIWITDFSNNDLFMLGGHFFLKLNLF